MKTNILYNSDCRSMQDIDNNSIDMVLTSPPYEDLRDYGSDNLSGDKWVDFNIEVLKECKSKLKEKGMICYNVGAKYTQKRNTYIYKLIIRAEAETGLLLIEDYPWIKCSFPPSKANNRGFNSYENIYVFAKTTNIVFNHDVVRVKYSDESIKRWKYKVTDLSHRGNNEPKTRRAITPNELGGLHPNYLIFPKFSGESFHPAPMSIDVIQFFINAYTQKGSIILDPMAGGGNVLFTAYEMGRQYIGYEINPEYCEKTNKILSQKRTMF